METGRVTEEEIERLVCITHIHEAAIKDEDIHKMLLSFYKEVCMLAKEKGIRFSIVDTRLIFGPSEKQIVEN